MTEKDDLGDTAALIFLQLRRKLWHFQQISHSQLLCTAFEFVAFPFSFHTLFSSFPNLMHGFLPLPQ